MFDQPGPKAADGNDVFRGACLRVQVSGAIFKYFLEVGRETVARKDKWAGF